MLEQYISICHVMDPFTAIAIGVGTYIGQKAVDGIANYASGFLKSKFGGGGGGGRRVGGILKQILKKPNLNKNIITGSFFTFKSKTIA